MGSKSRGLKDHSACVHVRAPREPGPPSLLAPWRSHVRTDPPVSWLHPILQPGLGLRGVDLVLGAALCGARPELVLGPGSHPKWEEIHTGQQARRGQEDCWLSLSLAGKAKGGLGTGAEASKGLARKWSVWGQLDMSIYAWLLHLCEAATCGPGPHL